jgi:hypothetical protein
MMRIVLSLVLLLMLAAGAAPVEAADQGVRRAVVATGVVTKRIIPRSPEAQLVWASDACWRGCAQDCGRHLKVCLHYDVSGNCLVQNASCDRFCQRECRLYGGPLLPWDW